MSSDPKQELLDFLISAVHAVEGDDFDLARTQLQAAQSSLAQLGSTQVWVEQVEAGRTLLNRSPTRARTLISAALDGAARAGLHPRLGVLHLLAACEDALGKVGNALDLWSEVLRLSAIHRLDTSTVVAEARGCLDRWAKFPRYFVSFTRADEGALSLARAFAEVAPDQVTIDEKDFVAGRPLRAQIVAAMRESTCLVLLVGPSYLQRPWTAREVQIADSLTESAVAWREDADDVFRTSAPDGAEAGAHVARFEVAGDNGLRRLVLILLAGLSPFPFWGETHLWMDARDVQGDDAALSFATSFLRPDDPEGEEG